MRGQKSNLSIFSFNHMQLKFIKGALFFLLPIVLIIAVLEFLVLQIPANYKNNSDYFNSEKDDITVMALGSSQMESAIDPTYFKHKTISLASKSQHHDLDFPIYAQLAPKMSKLKTVVFELSYSHLEIPHNGNYFWKNSVYLKYYNVNAFERKTYFKDELMYLSNPHIFSRLLVNYYIKNTDNFSFNKYGVDISERKGFFESVKYSPNIIKNADLEIRTKELPQVFKYNTAYFYKILDHATENGLQIVVTTVPLYKEYLKARNPNILRRRDSVLKDIELKYPNLKVLREEEDTLHFNIRDFDNQNHLNPSGAKKFSELLDNFIAQNFPK